MGQNNELREDAKRIISRSIQDMLPDSAVEHALAGVTCLAVSM